jgi:hypothetical protein
MVALRPSVEDVVAAHSARTVGSIIDVANVTISDVVSRTARYRAIHSQARADCSSI